MDSRALLFLGIALLLCLVPSSDAQITFSSVITKDNMVDVGGIRSIVISIQTTTSSSAASNANAVITVGQTLPSTSQTLQLDLPATSCSSVPMGTNCIQGFKFMFQPNPPSSCRVTAGDFSFSYSACDANSNCQSGIETVSVAEHNLCASPMYTIAADITSFGAFADPGFSRTKTTYYVNDMVYFPFQVKYRDLTIASLSFNTITVESGSTFVDIYSSSSNTGAGTAVELQTSPVITQVNSGSVTAWFGLEISRNDMSPFAATPASLTPTTYTFSVVFDVEYKNAKRSKLTLQGVQLHSEVSINVSGEQVRIPSQDHTLVQPALKQPSAAANSGYSLHVGMVSVAVMFIAAAGVVF